MAKRAAEACSRVPSLGTLFFIDPYNSVMRCDDSPISRISLNPQKSEKDAPEVYLHYPISMLQKLSLPHGLCSSVLSALGSTRGGRFPKLEPSRTSHCRQGGHFTSSPCRFLQPGGPGRMISQCGHTERLSLLSPGADWGHISPPWAESQP